ncbi:restriction endonuclease subunit S [Thermoflavimicrobium daqui]|nr:restriction endonuclease subunit S [Thermoflavimicrobium daqui]
MKTQWIKVKDIFDIQKGKKMTVAYEQEGILHRQEKGSSLLASSDEYQPKVYRYLQCRDLKNRIKPKYISVIGDAVTVDHKDIILVWDGVNAGDIYTGLSGVIGSTLAVLKPKNDTLICTDYIARYLQSQSPLIKSRCKGATVRHIQREFIENLLIPLPDIERQRKISKILGQLELLIQKQKQAIAMVDEWIQSIFYGLFDDPVQNTKNWEMNELGSGVSSIVGGWSPVCIDQPTPKNGWGVLKLSAISQGFYKEEENKTLPSQIDARETLTVQVGDLLICRKNVKELVGKCAYVFETRDHLLIPDTMFRLRIHPRSEKLDPIFLWKLLNEKNMRIKIQQLASGSASSMLNISKSKLLQLSIILPPLSLQKTFASIVCKSELKKKKMKEYLYLLEKVLLYWQQKFHLQREDLSKQ